MQVDADMNAILLSPGDRLVDLGQFGFKKDRPVSGPGVDAVIDRQAHKVEAEPGNHLKIFFVKAVTAPFHGEKSEQIEAAPAGGKIIGRFGRHHLKAHRD